MNQETIITLRQIGQHFRIDHTLIQEFAEFGLYDTIALADGAGVERPSLKRLQRVISLHQALGVNKEGIDIILDLRDQVSRLHQEIAALHQELDRLHLQAELPSAADLENQGLLIEIREIE